MWLREFEDEINQIKSQAVINQEMEVDKFYRIRENEARKRRNIMKYKGRENNSQTEFLGTVADVQRHCNDKKIDYDSMLRSVKEDVDSVGRVKAERPPYQQNFLAPD